MYHRWMARTNIEIDERLMAAAKARYGLHTQREVVELALRRLVGEPLARDEALALEGSGWDADLEELRATRPILVSP